MPEVLPPSPGALPSVPTLPSEAASTAARSLPRRVTRWVFIACVAAGLTAGAACSTADESDAQRDEPDAEILEALDTDEDGLVSRADYDDHLEETEIEAELAAQEEEQQAQEAERLARVAAQEAAARVVIDDPEAVAARYPGGLLTSGDVRANLEAEPMSLMDDPQNPTREEFVARMTSMLQLRLAAIALTDLGFEVDLNTSDEEINNQILTHIDGEFELVAQQMAIEEDPTISRLATPHCVSVLVVASEAEAIAAVGQVQSGESFADVAAQANLEGLTDPDGSVGCGPPLDLFGSGPIALALLELPAGEMSEPIQLPSGSSPTGELWVVLSLDELRTEETDLASIGPFAGRVLSGIMTEYEVEIAPDIGEWSTSSLSVGLPPTS